MTTYPKILRYAYATAYSYLDPAQMSTAYAAISTGVI